jgi:glyoxylase-like metal-dependent hydrolase (beta-lactamase superfamily II)
MMCATAAASLQASASHTPPKTPYRQRRRRRITSGAASPEDAMTAQIPAPIVIGDITIHRIVEQEGPLFDAAQFFPGLSPDMYAPHRHWLEPRFFDGQGKVVLCIQSYVIKTRTHTIMVDTCVGNHKERVNRPFWHRMNSDRYARNLAAAGFSVADIDIVMCTHLHGDHVGWNTTLEDGRWVPTFPRARYLFADAELAHWTGKHAADPASLPWITDSVLPIVALNRADLVKSDHQLGDAVRLLPTPGHSIDHFSVHVGAAGTDAIITGDAIHSPVQTHYPDLGMFSDYNAKQGAASRRMLLERCCDTPTLFCTAHFASPSVGHIVQAGDAFAFKERA